MFNNRSGGLLGIRNYNDPALRTSGLLGIPLSSLATGSASPYPSEAGGGANRPIEPSSLLALTFPPLPTDGDINPDIQPAKDPLKCSGPNSRCEELPSKGRPIAPFRDPQNPPFRLCRHCFKWSQGREGMGDDT